MDSKMNNDYMFYSNPDESINDYHDDDINHNSNIEERDHLINTNQNEFNVTRTTRWLRRVYNDFKSFINRGNVVDLAIGIVIGEAFSGIVGSFVVDIFSPILGLLVSSKLSEAFLVIKKGANHPYKTREEAKNDGAITWNYGNFLQLCTNFVCISVCLFLVVRVSHIIRKKHTLQNESNQKDCPFCFSKIDKRSTKCPHCCSVLNDIHSDT